tara:strand:+ start:31737 stop:33137 length:1401 start_codon:yes stop_codon:yes gene_type:complete
MKTITFILLLFVSTVSVANDTFSYTLEKHQKFEKTFSFAVENATIHLIIVKNKDTKKYDLIPFYMNSQQMVNQFETSSFEDVPDIFAYHTNGDVVSISTFQDKTIAVLDYNLQNGSVLEKTWESKDKPVIKFIDATKTKYLERTDKETLELTTITTSADVQTKKISVSKEFQKAIKEIFKEPVSIVDNQNFVKHGAISEIQGYFNDETIYFTFYDYFQKDTPEILIIDITTGIISQKQILQDVLEKPTDFNAHIVDDMLFASFLTKEDLAFQVYDAKSGSVKQSHTLNGTLSQLRTIKGKRLAYLKKTKKFKFKSTVSVNKTQDNKYAVVVDVVNRDTYHHYDWFWLHTMMFNQQMMLNMGMPGGFGPKDFITEDIINYWASEDSIPLEFVLDANFNLLPDHNGATLKEFVDKEKYAKQLAENKTVFNSSIGFLENEYRYIYTNKDEDVVTIKTRPIKRRVRSNRK